MVEARPEAVVARAEAIHVSRLWKAPLRHAHQPVMVRMGLYMLGVYAGTALIGIPNPLTRVFGDAYVAAAVLPLFILGPPLLEWRLFRLRRARRQRLSLAPIESEPDPNCRVRLVGLPGELDEYGQLQDVNFEPRLFRGGLGVPLDARILLRCALLSPALMIAIGLIRSSYSPGGWFVNAFSSLMPAGIAAWTLTVFIWPRYIRVVPGRLDIVEFSPFGTEPRCRSYSLTRPTITVDMNRQIAVVGPRERHEIGFGLIPDGRRLAYYILLAAISTHSPGPLPRDGLTG